MPAFVVVRRLAFVLAWCALAPIARGQAVPAGDDLARGRTVFLSRCVLCHGPAADGNGQMAKLLDPRPANLARSRLDPRQREAIVRGGGAGVGRSPAMPRWEGELSEDELRGVLAFVADVAARGGLPPVAGGTAR